jgi:hypothetical protein
VTCVGVVGGVFGEKIVLQFVGLIYLSYVNRDMDKTCSFKKMLCRRVYELMLLTVSVAK